MLGWVLTIDRGVPRPVLGFYFRVFPLEVLAKSTLNAGNGYTVASKPVKPRYFLESVKTPAEIRQLDKAKQGENERQNNIIEETGVVVAVEETATGVEVVEVVKVVEVAEEAEEAEDLSRSRI